MRCAGLALRSALWSVRAAPVRSLLLVVSVAIGTALLLLAAAIPVAARTRQDRELAMTPVVLDVGGELPRSYLLWHPLPGEFLGRDAMLAAVAAVGPEPPPPPGLRRPPAPGELAVSPALAALLASPEGRVLLRPRLPGRIVAMIGPEGLPSPQALVGYVGVRPSQLVKPDIVVRFGRPAGGSVRAIGPGVIAMVAVLVLGVLGPVASLLVAAMRLSSRTREARWAALRLAGAPMRFLRSVAAVEAAALALAGTALGIPLFLWARVLLAGVLPDPFRWFPWDLRVGPISIVGVLLGLPGLAASLSWTAMCRIEVTPFQVVRGSVRPTTSRAWVPMLGGGMAGLTLAAAASAAGRGATGSTLVAGLAGLTLGAGAMLPQLSRAAASFVARRSRSPALLLGSHLAAADPGLLGRAAGAVAVIVLLGGMGQAFVLAAAPSDLTAVMRRTAARPDTVFVSVWDARGSVDRVLRSVEGVRSVERRRTTVVGATGGRELRNFAVRTDGRNATAERIENALAYEGSLVDVTWAPEVRRRWLAPWLKVRGVADAAVAAALLVVWLGLLVSSIDRSLEQRRIVAALAATGTPAGVLRLGIVAQVLIPLLLSVALGWALFVPATALVFSAARAALVLPVRYTASLALSAVVLGVATAGLTFPWVRALTSPAALRAE